MKYVEAERYGTVPLLQDEMVRESPPLPDRDDSPPPIHRTHLMKGKDGCKLSPFARHGAKYLVVHSLEDKWKRDFAWMMSLKVLLVEVLRAGDKIKDAFLRVSHKIQVHRCLDR